MDNRLLTLDDIACALGFIGEYNDREIWVQMGMAIKSEFGDDGFHIWDHWSANSDLYKPQDAKTVWKSIKQSGRTGIGTLIKRAQDNGYKFSVKAIDKDERERRKAEAIKRKAENKKRIEADRIATKEKHETAIKRANDIWPGLSTDGASPYLKKKQIYHFGARFAKNQTIVVPVYRFGTTSADFDLVGLQFIDPDGGKKFLTGTPKTGGFYKIPGTQPGTVLCEGFATGASIATATQKTVYVCFDARNLVAVAKQFSNPQPYIVAADNDHTKENNKGLQVAHEIRAFNPDAILVWPVFPLGDTGTDFNDLHTSQGLDAVKKAIDGPTPEALPHNFSPNKDEISEFSPPEAALDDGPPGDDWEYRIKRSDRGAVLPLSSNVELILTHDANWRGSLAYCDFSYRIIKRHAALPDMTAGEWEDADTARLAIWLSTTYGFEPPRNKINDAVIVAAQRARFHPVREYLQSLEWDQTPRIDSWLSDVYESTSPAEYLKVVGSKYLIAAVARVMKPGCKMDNVMILEGSQGMRKSSSLAILFGEWFSDAPIPIGDKDAYQNIQGVWCSELAELDSFNKAESTSAKSFFSQRRDRYRPSYGQHAQDYQRQTIFTGTTNQGEYLKDPTGNRRYWPVRCLLANIRVLTDNRDQYWAEALHRYKAGETWWPDDATREVFEKEQDERLQVDPWHYPIADYLAKSAALHHTADELLTLAICKDLGNVTRADQNRVSPIMKSLGYKKVKKRIQVGNNKEPRNVYVPEMGAQK